jgi:hypothetical protein
LVVVVAALAQADQLQMVAQVVVAAAEGAEALLAAQPAQESSQVNQD